MGDGIRMQSPLNFLIKLITLQYIVLPDWLSASPVAVTIDDWVPKSAVKEGTHCLRLNTLLPLCRSCYVINLYLLEIRRSFEANRCLIQISPKWFACSDPLFIYAHGRPKKQ